MIFRLLFFIICLLVVICFSVILVKDTGDNRKRIDKALRNETASNTNKSKKKR